MTEQVSEYWENVPELSQRDAVLAFCSHHELGDSMESHEATLAARSKVRHLVVTSDGYQLSALAWRTGDTMIFLDVVYRLTRSSETTKFFVSVEKRSDGEVVVRDAL